MGSERSSLPRTAYAAIGLLLAALPAGARAPQKSAPKAAPAEYATIENTGSTNTLGYRIVVNLAYARPAVDDMEAANSLPPDLRRRLFRDLHAAMPLSALPARHGLRSASFGTRTFITYKGQRSPDLSFGGDPRVQALKADVDAITRTLHVGNLPRRPATTPPGAH